jgi:hypothetical protein
MRHRGTVSISAYDVNALAALVESEVGRARGVNIGNVIGIVDSVITRTALGPTIDAHYGATVIDTINAPKAYSAITAAGGVDNYLRANPPQQSTIDAVKERLAEIAVSARTSGVIDFGNPRIGTDPGFAARVGAGLDSQRAMRALAADHFFRETTPWGDHVYGQRPSTRNTLAAHGIDGIEVDVQLAPDANVPPISLSTPSERAGKRSSAEAALNATVPSVGILPLAPNALLSPDAMGTPGKFGGTVDDPAPMGPDPSRFAPDLPAPNTRGEAAPLVRTDVAPAPQTVDDLAPGSFHGGVLSVSRDADSLVRGDTDPPPPTFAATPRLADIPALPSPAPAGLGVFGAATNGAVTGEGRAAAGMTQLAQTDLAPGNFHDGVPDIEPSRSAAIAPTIGVLDVPAARANAATFDIGYLGPPRGPDAAPQMIVGHTDIGPMGRGLGPTFSTGQFDLAGIGLPGSLGDHAVLDEPPDAPQRAQAQTTAAIAAAAAAQPADAPPPGMTGRSAGPAIDQTAVQAPSAAPESSVTAPVSDAPTSRPGISAPAAPATAAPSRAPVADAPRAAPPRDAVRPPLSPGMTTPSLVGEFASLPTPADYAQLGLSVNDYLHDLAMGMAAAPPGMEGYASKMNSDQYGVAFTQALQGAVAAQPFGGLTDALGRGTFGQSYAGDYMPGHPTNAFGAQALGMNAGVPTTYGGIGDGLGGVPGSVGGGIGFGAPSEANPTGISDWGAALAATTLGDGDFGFGGGDAGGESAGSFSGGLGGGYGGSEPAPNGDNTNADRGGGVATGASDDGTSW